MAWLLEALQAREWAARARVEALRAEMDRLAEHLAAAQELLGRLEITRQTVVEVLAGDDLPGGDGVGIGPDPQTGAGAAAPRVGAKVPRRPRRLLHSRAALAALVATLGGAQAGGWTHDQLEDHLETGGRELLRLLLQDHLDLRALRERHAVAQGRVGPVTDADGTCHRKVEPGHVRHLTTVFGTVRVTRCAWRADGTPTCIRPTLC